MADKSFKGKTTFGIWFCNQVFFTEYCSIFIWKKAIKHMFSIEIY